MTAIPEIPITLICGYLGSGKTTLINRLLNTPDLPKKIAVLVNDFGELNIDAELIEMRSSNDEIVSLSNGCVCCKIQDDLAISLESLKSRSIDRVIIEASGVAIPSKLKKQCLIPGFVLGQCAVLVDAHSYNVKRNDKYVGHLVKQQVQEAGLIVLTKLDLAPNFELELEAARHTGHQNAISTEQISATDGELLTRLFQDRHLEIEHSRASEADPFATRTLRQNKSIPKEQLVSLIENLPKAIERFKGFIETDDSLVLVQGTNQTYRLSDQHQSATLGLVIIYPEQSDLSIEELFDEWSQWFVIK